MLKLIDLFAILALAVVLLLPKASVNALPALEGPSVELDAIAAAQDDLARDPFDVGAAARLAHGFLDFGRVDWALATVGPQLARESQGAAVDARAHLIVAAARAERYEIESALAAVPAVEKACEGGEGTARCPAGTVARMQLIAAAMTGLRDQKIDPIAEPQRARLEVYKALHPSRPGFTR